MKTLNVLLAVRLLASLTVTVRLKMPLTVGVPAMRPVEFIVSPEGAPVKLHTSGSVPPEA
jgi:hypothetical protein